WFLCRYSRYEVCRVARRRLQRIELLVGEDRLGNRAETILRNLVALEWQPRHRILYHQQVALGVFDAREVALAPRGRRDADHLLAGPIPQEPLVVPEEEQLVLHDRAADGRAEDVLRQVGLGGVSP